MHCASLLRTIFASSARAHGRVHEQNVRDFPQTKLDGEINFPFLLNEHGDPDFFQVFAKNNLQRTYLKKKKSLIAERNFLLENSPLLDVFWPRPGLQANHGTVWKSAMFPQPSNQKQLKWSNTSYVNKKVIRIFNA